jgi:hypothetical protein
LATFLQKLLHDVRYQDILCCMDGESFDPMVVGVLEVGSWSGMLTLSNWIFIGGSSCLWVAAEWVLELVWTVFGPGAVVTFRPSPRGTGWLSGSAWRLGDVNVSDDLTIFSPTSTLHRYIVQHKRTVKHAVNNAFALSLPLAN